MGFEQKSPEELKQQVEAVDMEYDQEDLTLTPKELADKYREPYESGEITPEAVKEYADKLREDRREWTERLDEMFDQMSYDDFPVTILEEIPPIFHKKIANELIDHGRAEDVVLYLEELPGVNQKEIVKKLIDQDLAQLVMDNSVKFKDFDADIADMFIESGHVEYVARAIGEFEPSAHKQIADKVMAAGYGHMVAEYLDEFEGVDHKEITDHLKETYNIASIVKNLEKFEAGAVDHKQLVDTLIELGQGFIVMSELEKFNDLDHGKIVEKLIELKRPSDIEAMLNNLEKLQGVDKGELSEKLTDAGFGNFVEKYSEKFEETA